jgi:hypothetical protein
LKNARSTFECRGREGFAEGAEKKFRNEYKEENPNQKEAESIK